MKKALIIIFTSILASSIIFYIYDSNYHKYKAPQEGDTSKWQNRLPKNKNYELALDYQGRPIFKNPKKAFKQLKKDYKGPLKKIKKQYQIFFNLNKYNYEAYHNLGWQTDYSNENERKNLYNISYILGIYENSIRGK